MDYVLLTTIQVELFAKQILSVLNQEVFVNLTKYMLILDVGFCLSAVAAVVLVEDEREISVELTEGTAGVHSAQSMPR